MEYAELRPEPQASSSALDICHSHVRAPCGPRWLPAYQYLSITNGSRATVSASFWSEGICNEQSPLFNPRWCESCARRRTHVNNALLYIFTVFVYVGHTGPVGPAKMPACSPSH